MLVVEPVAYAIYPASLLLEFMKRPGGVVHLDGVQTQIYYFMVIFDP